MAENGVLSTKQARAVAALLSSSTTAEAATAAGVGERTLVRWLADDGFRLAVREAQAEAIASAVRRLVAGLGVALDTLQAVMADAALSPAVRVRASAVWLDVSLRWSELADLELRVAALEDAQKQS